ncbi:brain acid soluble protein 1 isoform X3 [Pleuronectes platessa]|uniref:brain acid soluble protein 1 isoform X3 n=1 Tax=Pleuronectes platessa TaxID=8262 RepID=UPI00232A687B|nr:brain acid soluble protein 1 isoform X3 [Pleuronectes platessa]
MMSYLWILLLGSLLATSAKAQEEEAAPEIPAPDAAAGPEVNAEPEETAAEEIQPSVSAPESDAEPEAGAEEPEAPATEDAEPAAPAAEETEEATPAADAAEDAEPAAPAAEDTEAAAPVAPAAEDAEPAAPAAGDEEEEATAAADAEAEAAATTQEPEADPEVKVPEVQAPEAEAPTTDVEEESTAGSDTTAAPVESGHVDEATPATDVAAEDNQELPTDPAADSKPDVPIVEEKILPAVIPAVRAVLPSADNEATKAEAAPVAAQEDDKPHAAEASSGSLAGILCGLAAAAVGSVVGFITYKKKKLCFSNRQEADPEAGRKVDTAEANSDPQVLSNLLNSS